jgi:hypothetical protein
MILERTFKKTRNEYGILILRNSKRWHIYQNAFNHGYRDYGIKIFKSVLWYSLSVAIYYGSGELVFDFTWKSGMRPQ